MKSPTEQPHEPLDYRTPTPRPATALRRKAWQQAFTNGVLCMGTSIVMAEPSFTKFALVWHGGVSTARAVASAAFCVNTACYFICGSIYLIASFKIRLRHVRWERALLWSGAIQLGILVLAISVTLLVDTNRQLDLSDILGLPFHLFFLAILFHMLQLACRACLWGE